MTAAEMKQKEANFVMHTYGRFDIALDYGMGATLWDIDNNKYIDMNSGIGVNSLGHGNEKLVKAVSEQTAKLMHASNLYYTAPMADVAEMLTTATGN